ncbi:sll0787 family AIR synthase-like protein [Desulfobacterota bacterium AH_259_B03_O07]|nr:sll0787 family AIR synthase-like protein [Desulfobacterota bacterium AH_259_B03_O07]
MQDLIDALRSSPRLNNKGNLKKIWDVLPSVCEIKGKEVILGDDAAAIKDHEGYLLLAAEGIFPGLLKSNPYLAGRTSVITNVSDIYAMGGRPMAILDVIFSPEFDEISDLLRGIKDNALRYNVPLVGGHLTNISDFSSLSVFILGKAEKLLSSFNARQDDDLIFVTSLNGRFYNAFNFWDCSSQLSADDAIKQLELLPTLAEDGLADSAKDISMAGLIGTVIMLLESSGKGAEIYIDRIPTPSDVDIIDWLLTFPSFGFIFSLRPENTPEIKKRFTKMNLVCEKIGKVNNGNKVFFVNNNVERKLFWDLEVQPLIGVKNKRKKVRNG